MGKQRWWQSKAQHKQSEDHITIRVSSLQLIIREAHAMGVEDERKRNAKLNEEKLYA